MIPFQKSIFKSARQIEVFVFDADYAVFTYEFSNGSDLDTRTRVVEPNIGQTTQADYLGWGLKPCQPTNPAWSNTEIPPDALLDWAGDNTGIGFESIFLDIKKLKLQYPGNDKFVVDLRCFWFGTVGTNPVVLNAKFYKGGTMIKGALPFQYTNPTAIETLEFTTNGKIISYQNNLPNNSGERFATFTYTISTAMGEFNPNDTTTPEV
jgi:hypothetical protein